MFLRDADFTAVPQFTDFPHRRTDKAVNYLRQRFAFQMRSDKTLAPPLRLRQRAFEEMPNRNRFFIAGAVRRFYNDSSPWLCFSPSPCSR
jgi:hypothetical protein